MNDKHAFHKKSMDLTLEALTNIKPDDAINQKCCSLLQFIQLIGNIISNINNYSKHLWNNETICDKCYQILDKLYGDLFNIVFYFGWYMGDEEKYNYNYTNKQEFYFYETILTWIVVQFMDQLPVTPPFIHDFSAGDMGNVTFFEFFLTFQTHMTMRSPFLKHNNSNYILLYGNKIKYVGDNWFDCIGLLRINFILSIYFFTNDKHFGQRNNLLNLPQVDRNLLNKIINNDLTNTDTTHGSRSQCIFSKDVSPFWALTMKNPTIRQVNRVEGVGDFFGTN